MKQIKAYEIALYGEGKYLRCLREEQYIFAKIKTIMPDQHLLVLEPLSKMQIDQPEFFAYYKMGDETLVDLYEEDEAVLMAFQD